MPFSARTPLHDLFPFVHPEVVSILPQLSSQRLYRYYQFCYHIFSVLSVQSVLNFFLRLLARHRMPVSIVYLVISSRFRDHLATIPHVRV